MSGIDNPIIFYLAAITMLLFSILALRFRNIFYSLLSAIIVFFIAGAVFYILGSEYNAVIQIAIYGVAVPILLGLAIMFTNLKNAKINQIDTIKTPYLNYIILLTAGVFILALIYLFLTSYAISPIGFNILEEVQKNPTNISTTFGNGIYVKYVWAFELVSLILTIVVVGLTMFKNAKYNISKEEVKECLK